MILASGGDLHLGVYIYYGHTCSILEWRIGELLLRMACCGVRTNSKIIFGNKLVRG